jgi:hypothetical protein
VGPKPNFTRLEHHFISLLFLPFEIGKHGWSASISVMGAARDRATIIGDVIMQYSVKDLT